MSQHSHSTSAIWHKLTSEYGMLGVLFLLCVFFSIMTLAEQHPEGGQAADSLLKSEFRASNRSALVIIVAGQREQDSIFVNRMADGLRQIGQEHKIVIGDPARMRSGLETLSQTGSVTLATTNSNLPVVSAIKSQLPNLQQAKITVPESSRWPTFLLADNIRNVANQITVIAIIAIGMTIVIITAGIDLSVGSLIAFCAVVASWLIHQWGGETSGLAVILMAATIGIVLSGLIGAFSGLMITRFRIPPFIATLAMMQVAAGIAYIISQGRPIYQIPDSFIWLGRGVDPVFGIPNAVILMVILYAVAHVIMSRTTLGRYIYAVGGNPEAARLSGVRVNRILMFAYIVSGLLAGLGGVLMASQLKSGAPTYGLTYELYVIAAVVVGGTSLSGGEGRILGTLIGALIIGVIQNGMNLVNVESYTQKVVLGLVILGAVLLDRLKHARWGFRKAAA